MRFLYVVGARPNFVKMAPVVAALRRTLPDAQHRLVHTGQHYDSEMSELFLRELAMPEPDHRLGVGSGTHAVQTARVMEALERDVLDEPPELAFAPGDVNSTLGAALVFAKLGIPYAHVESGLRSFDRSMPEEINRLVTDAISDQLFVSEESGRTNLLKEGVDPGKIHFVGNVMIDCLERFRPLWARSDVRQRIGVDGVPYGVVTLHRPSNVDEPAMLEKLMEALVDIGRQIPLIFPVHPRTRQRLASLDVPVVTSLKGPQANSKGILCVDPLGYVDFMALVSNARIVLTDSGGLQEEASVLGVPCLTMRENTERPATVTHGTNRIVGTSTTKIMAEAWQVLDEPKPAPKRPALWDGRTSERIISILRKI